MAAKGTDVPALWEFMFSGERQATREERERAGSWRWLYAAEATRDAGSSRAAPQGVLGEEEVLSRGPTGEMQGQVQETQVAQAQRSLRREQRELSRRVLGRKVTFKSIFLTVMWRKGVLDGSGGHDGLMDSHLLSYNHLWSIGAIILLYLDFPRFGPGGEQAGGGPR